METILKRNPIKRVTDENEKMDYLLLFYLYGHDDKEDYQEWVIVTGRTDAYNTIRTYLEYDIDIDKSFILTEKKSLKDKITIHEFVDLCAYNNIFPEEDRINIQEYVDSDNEFEAEEQHIVDTPEFMQGASRERLTMFTDENGDSSRDV